ncbi:putative mannosyl-oligosaccharide 1,2-alpha-mannosidase IB [Trypanosoma cruzi]|uniref:alpha-1,2-Mannosidase n=1 Tax=Trypanosoma cruzi TaxID=5693 RepID=A0A2V2UXD3_TRYCR|nr:putative mannosyl-oligosaccharide 1,2-alpha-mannosidase IB [Trypanosoma cruzi]
MTGRWISFDSSVGDSIDSAIEYFIKSHVMSGDIGDWERFERTVRDVNRYVRKCGMLTTVDMSSGRPFSSAHQSLASFFPGNLILGGHLAEATESNWPITASSSTSGRYQRSFLLGSGGPHGGYPQRPEHVESVYMLYRATHDPAYLVMGKELALAINLRMRTPYGFATLRKVDLPHGDEQHGDTMESFMLAETLKYLYLLFDECNACMFRGSSVAASRRIALLWRAAAVWGVTWGGCSTPRRIYSPTRPSGGASVCRERNGRGGGLRETR